MNATQQGMVDFAVANIWGLAVILVAAMIFNPDIFVRFMKLFSTGHHIFIINRWFIIGIGQTDVISVKYSFLYEVCRLPGREMLKFFLIWLGNFTILTKIAI